MKKPFQENRFFLKPLGKQFLLILARFARHYHSNIHCFHLLSFSAQDAKYIYVTLFHTGKQKSFKAVNQNGVITDVKFEDVCGVDEAKEELEDVVEYLQDPEKFTKMGAKLPKGAVVLRLKSTRSLK